MKRSSTMWGIPGWAWVAMSVAVWLCITGFKPITHMHSANQALQDVQGDGEVRIEGRDYPLDPALQEAITGYPDEYRGGSVGPDGFPDLIFGQGSIHPDIRCNNGADPCQESTGTSFTYEWLSWIYRSGQNYWNDPANDTLSQQRVRAFVHGFLTHASGDLWAHTSVNYYAKGIFPSIAEMAINPEKAKIGIRHIISEGYIGKATPQDTTKTLDAPLDFVRSTFIRNKEPQIGNQCPEVPPRVPSNLGSESHFAAFLNLREDLCDTLQDMEGIGWEDIFVDCLLAACTDTIEAYLGNWIDDIDAGLEKWPEILGLRVSRELFTNDGNFDGAKGVVTDFTLLYLLSMLGAPDAVGGGLHAVSEVIDTATETQPIKGFIDSVKWIQDLVANMLVQNITGLSIDEIKSYIKNPENYLADDPIVDFDFPDGSLAYLDQELQRAPGSTIFSHDNYATFVNATNVARLILLSPEMLDNYLFDKHVGKLYTGERIRTYFQTTGAAPAVEIPGTLADEMQRNVMLGFTRSIDGNHTWMRKSPDLEASLDFQQPMSSYRTLGEGMPIWTDCLARERVFKELFLDSVSLGIGSVRDDECEVLADALPPVSLIIIHPAQGETPQGCGFRGAARVINHLDKNQPYTFYYRVLGGLNRIVYHRVVHRQGNEALPPRSERIEEIMIPACLPEGYYRVEVFLFEQMNRLLDDLDIRKLPNTEIDTEAPYFSVEVRSPQEFGVQMDDPDECQTLRTYPCGDSGGLEGTQPGGLICTELVPMCPGGAIENVLLDADDDDVADVADNCSAVPNENQLDSDGNGVGDACQSISGLHDWGRLADLNDFLERADVILEYLRRMGLLDPPSVGNPFCLSCPQEFREMASQVREYLAQADREGLKGEEIIKGLGRLLSGPRQQIFNGRLLDGKYDPKKRSFHFFTEGRGKSVMYVEVPRVLVRGNEKPGPIKYQAKAGNRTLHIKVEGRGTIDVLRIPVPQERQEIILTGK